MPLREYADLEAVAAEMDGIMERLNVAEAQYEPLLGPNSNSVVRTFLFEFGLPPLQPAAVAPGFEHDGLIVRA